MIEITAEHLHRAANLAGTTQDPSELGFAPNALEEFVENSNWHATVLDGPSLDLDPLALAIGVSIGVIAGQQRVEHEAHEEAS